MTDTGGKEIDCPLCVGVGTIDIPKVVVKKKRAAKVVPEPDHVLAEKEG